MEKISPVQKVVKNKIPDFGYVFDFVTNPDSSQTVNLLKHIEEEIFQFNDGQLRQTWETRRDEALSLAKSFVDYIGSPLLLDVFNAWSHKNSNSSFDQLLSVFNDRDKLQNKVIKCSIAKVMLVVLYVMNKPEFIQMPSIHQNLKDLLSLSEQESNPTISVQFFEYEQIAVLAEADSTLTLNVASRPKTIESIIFKLLRQKSETGEDYQEVISDLAGFRFSIKEEVNVENKIHQAWLIIIQKLKSQGCEVVLAEIANKGLLDFSTAQAVMSIFIQQAGRVGADIDSVAMSGDGGTFSSSSLYKDYKIILKVTLPSTSTSIPVEIQFDLVGNQNERKDSNPYFFKVKQRIELLTRLFGRVSEDDLIKICFKMARADLPQGTPDDDIEARASNFLQFIKNHSKVIKFQHQKSTYYADLNVWNRWRDMGVLPKEYSGLLQPNKK